jgi:threonine aldolase
MFKAPVGDDVYGEDPTINQLQEMAARLMGKESALFIPSGTMGNLAAILAHCSRGDEVILGNLSHTFLYECGGISSLGGVHSHQLPNQLDGTLEIQDIRSAIRSDDSHFPISRLIVLENTHNRCGGISIGLDYTRTVANIAQENKILMHLDGARVFNAAAALGVNARELAEPFDSVTFCLSKGLCAPVGSVLCGSEDFIYQAHRIRKQLGGGMRQAGILAAAGIIALEKMVPRIGEDHHRAHQLARSLKTIPGIILDSDRPASNMVYFDLDPEATQIDAAQLANSLNQHGVKIGVVDTNRVRLVTHYWIDDGAVEYTTDAFKLVLE